MAVKIGSARIDENGNAHGGKAGDQTGREVSVQNWYLHKKGWRVFRCKDPAKAELMAQNMQAACDNPNIGYDQWQRHTLYKAAKLVGFILSRVKTKCETDCSALIRVLLALIGVSVPEEFRTGNMPGYLLKSGMFVELTGDKYQAKSAYLRRGDILVTKTSGHTVMVLSDGSKAEKNVPATSGAAETPKAYALGDRVLKKGMKGDDVKALQRALNAAGHDCGGADGDFGAKTDAAVRAFQQAAGLDVDGQAGVKTIAALNAAAPAKPAQVQVVGTAVNVRSAPGTTGTRVLGIVHKDNLLEYQGQDIKVDGVPWYLVVYRGENAWISGKYSEIVG